MAWKKKGEGEPERKPRTRRPDPWSWREINLKVPGASRFRGKLTPEEQEALLLAIRGRDGNVVGMGRREAVMRGRGVHETSGSIMTTRQIVEDYEGNPDPV